MAVRSSESFEAYRSTKVPVHESQADVRELLRNRKATGLQIAESWLGEQAVAEVRFAIPAGTGGYFAYRLRVKVPDPGPLVKTDQYSHRPRPATEAEVREHRSGTERQIWRLVYWWLKAQFEAAEAGLVALEEALLPWMELPDGRTVFEVSQENGGLAKIAKGTLPLQLGAGR
jgi:hypothetical protein